MPVPVDHSLQPDGVLVDNSGGWWSRLVDASPMLITDGWVHSSNVSASDSAARFEVELPLDHAAELDGWLQGDLGSSFADVWAVVRCEPDTFTCVVMTRQSDGQYRLWDVIDGDVSHSGALLAQSSGAPTSGVSRIRLEAEGSALRGYNNDQLVITGTNDFNREGRYAGWGTHWAVGGGSATNLAARVRNFSAYGLDSLSVPGARPQVGLLGQPPVPARLDAPISPDPDPGEPETSVVFSYTFEGDDADPALPSPPWVFSSGSSWEILNNEMVQSTPWGGRLAAFTGDFDPNDPPAVPVNDLASNHFIETQIEAVTDNMTRISVRHPFTEDTDPRESGAPFVQVNSNGVVYVFLGTIWKGAFNGGGAITFPAAVRVEVEGDEVSCTLNGETISFVDSAVPAEGWVSIYEGSWGYPDSVRYSSLSVGEVG